jgi:hypothetical protein
LLVVNARKIHIDYGLYFLSLRRAGEQYGSCIKPRYIRNLVLGDYLRSPHSRTVHLDSACTASRKSRHFISSISREPNMLYSASHHRASGGDKGFTTPSPRHNFIVQIHNVCPCQNRSRGRLPLQTSRNRRTTYLQHGLLSLQPPALD